MNPTIRWLSFRVRILCIVVLLIGSLLPPYVPKAALAPQDVTISSSQFLLVEDGFLMKSSSLNPQGGRRAYSTGTIHTVKEGDTVEGLANRYNVSKDTILWANHLDNERLIRPGDELLILPVDGVLHTVGRGQTLSRIAELYAIPQENIAEQNSIQGGFILAGQDLIIPGGKPIVGKPVIASADRPTPVIPDTPVKADPNVPAPSQPVVVAEEIAPPTPGVLQKPCSDTCFITQYFTAGHYALDMQERGGGPIYAAEAGTVTRTDYGWSGGYGNVIEIDHGNGLVTLYGHNKELYVEVGDSVQRGQKIAWMGNTGLVYGKTGIHVHFEVQVNGVKKNPLLYLQ